MRRASLLCLALPLLVVPVAAADAGEAAPAAKPASCPLPASPARTADQLWKELVAGNAVFVDGDVHYAGLRPLRRALEGRQEPPVSIVSCADSRVMPEVVFDRSVGELFVTRVAGNIVGTFDVASLEYAVLNGWTSLIVVMGHSDCGAMRAAMKPDDPNKPLTPALQALVGEIRRSFTRDTPRTPDATPAQLRAATEANARFVAEQLRTKASALLKTCVDAGLLKIVPAYYDAGSGKVERLD